MKKFYGGLFMDRAKLKRAGINYPIKLEYYKITEEGIIDIFGIEVIKTEYKKDRVTTEKIKINSLTEDEVEANYILDMLKKNEVTPITAKDVLRDYIYC